MSEPPIDLRVLLDEGSFDAYLDVLGTALLAAFPDLEEVERIIRAEVSELGVAVEGSEAPASLARAALVYALYLLIRENVAGAWFKLEEAVGSAEAAGDEGFAAACREVAQAVEPAAFQPWSSLEEHHAAYRVYVRELIRVYVDKQKDAGRYGTDKEPRLLGTDVPDAELSLFLERDEPSLELARRERFARSDRLLRRRDELSAAAGMEVPLVTLARRFGLRRAEQLVLLIGALSLTDRAFERVLRHAWNDFSVELPKISFLGDLLRPALGSELAMDAAFDPQGALLSSALVSLTAPHLTSLADKHRAYVEVPDSVAGFVLGSPQMSARLGDLAVTQDRGCPAREPFLFETDRDTIARCLAFNQARGRDEVVFLVGGRGAGKRTLAVEAARHMGMAGTLVLRGAMMTGAAPTEIVSVARQALRDARLLERALAVEIPETVEGDGRAGQLEAALATALAGTRHPILLMAPDPPRALLRGAFPDAFELRVGALATEAKEALWAALLAKNDASMHPAADASAVLGRLSLSAGGLRRMFGAALTLAARRTAPGEATSIRPEEVAASVVDEVDAELAAVATRVPLTLNWDDIVLPEDLLIEINDVISFARYREKVLQDWGFERKLPYGKALSVLFYGPPGTGKTMMALIIARDLGMELFRVDLSQVISKYIGETEKRLKTIFDQAEDGRAIILFEEADSLFAKRTEVSSSTDRYANVEVNYLLQKVESFNGVAILTTNNFDGIDDAFKRRIRFRLKFPMPDPELRAQIWQTMLPRELPLEGAIDWAYLGRKFDFAPAYIKGAVLRAAFKAAEMGTGVNERLLEEAGVTESKQMGMVVRDVEPD